LLTIVPEDAGIEIEAQIENKDIGFVAEGQETVVKLDALPFTRCGTMVGHLATVSGDAVEQPGGNGQPPRLINTACIRREMDVMKVDGKAVQLLPRHGRRGGDQDGDKEAYRVCALSADAHGR
jgi:hemolysin D